ncbi:uncharacterized protein LOC129574568 [Sitodiplosis mosellana]|uniref:uncharacterized protein LOC129574568 n=1 Tax=Sitodiplosis mosellana TaxID=263140 RepID=UPI00244384DE|nr:uncharacterized protein LOC129574568 [Sitodiplosis mosellana]
MVLKVVCLILAVIATANAVVFSKCDQDPEAVKVVIDNCNDNYCEVKRSQPAKMEVTFKTAKQATELTGTIHALINGVWIPWPMGAAGKVCRNLSKGQCPVAENTEATYAVSIKVPFVAPVGTKTVVQIRISDQDKTVVACTRIPVLVAA